MDPADIDKLMDHPLFDVFLTVLAGAVLMFLYTKFFTTGKKADELAAETAAKIEKQRKAQNKGEAKSYTLEEVAKHKNEGDLWLIIKNKVYDFSKYADQHPGGRAIFNQAGEDATEGFSGDQHPERVWTMIPDYYIGELTPEAIQALSQQGKK
eukprot:tig00000158_g10164.t1